MRFSRISWLLAGLAVVALATLLIRLLSPRRAEAPASANPISDLSVTSPLNQAGGGAVEPEAYEIYSALYQTPQPETLAFAENSVTDVPQVNGTCLRPSTPQEHEMVDAFLAANKQSHRWGQEFTMETPYRMLSRAEAERAQSCIAHQETGAANCDPYKQLRHVRYLGIPGFDHTHTHALVSVMKKCGANCGSGGIFVVEKNGNTWQRVETSDFVRDCSWMY